jgi:RND superfamily putative drug exporter
VATLLHRLGDFSRRHARSVIVGWLLLLALTTAGAVGLGKPLTNTFEIPGAGYQKVFDQLQREIPSASGGIGTVVLSSESGPFTDAQKRAVAGVVDEWSRLDGVREVRDPFVVEGQLKAAADQTKQARQELDQGRAQLQDGEKKLEAERAKLDAAQQQLDAQGAQLPPGVPAPAQLAAAQQQLEDGRAQLEAQAKKLEASKQELEAGERELAVGERQVARSEGLHLVSTDGTVGLTQIQFEGNAQEIPSATKDELQQIGKTLAPEGVRADFSAEIVQDVSSVIGPGEITGMVIAGIVLLVVLGTLIAAGLPLVMSLIGVAVGIGGTLAMSRFVDMNSVTPALALMLGLAVGIDYALFIISRHRNQLLTGMSREESIPRATGTAGTAVLFAGSTVIVALAALTVTGVPFLGVMGLAAAFTVLVAVLVAITLTPAVLEVAKHRIIPRRVWRRNGFTDRGEPLAGEAHLVEGDGEAAARARSGWAGRVTRHRWIFALASIVLLGVIAIPAASLRLGLPDGGSEAPGSTAYRTYSLTAEHFGAGANGPIIGVATLPAGLDESGAQERSLDVADRLATVDGVTAVVPFGMSDDRRTAAFQIVPADGPAEESTVATVEALRDSATAIAGATGAAVQFTGQTVANIDISQILSDSLPLYLAIVVGLSLVILVLIFRSLIVPLIATGGFLLSLAASFGAVVAVYQWGWLGGLLGVNQPTAILSFLPTLLIGVLFGLAMDYQMFLVSGMREAHQHGQDARGAVLTGFHHGRVVVTAAALIMVAVFAGFVHADLTMIRPIGLGLAFGVLVDAFVVRMTLTPAVMHLLGEKAWWIPRWLDRILPDVDVEGASLSRALEARAEVGREHEPAGRHTS